MASINLYKNIVDKLITILRGLSSQYFLLHDMFTRHHSCYSLPRASPTVQSHYIRYLTVGSSGLNKTAPAGRLSDIFIKQARLKREHNGKNWIVHWGWPEMISAEGFASFVSKLWPLVSSLWPLVSNLWPPVSNCGHGWSTFPTHTSTSLHQIQFFLAILDLFFTGLFGPHK